MPYDVKWLIEDYIVSQRFWGVFTADEALAADARVIELLEHSPQTTVHAIVDDAQVTQMPPVTALAKVKSSRHDKLGWTVIFGNKSAGMRFTTKLANRILGFKMLITPTYQEAIEKLYELDPDLPPLDD